MKNKFYRLLSLALTTLVTLSCIAVRAQGGSKEIHNFDLKQCVDYAVANHVTMLNAKIDEKISSARVKETRSIGLPQVSGSIDFKDYLTIPTSLIPGDFVGAPGTYIPVQFGVQYNATVGLNMSWLALDATYFTGLKAAKVYEELSKRSTESTKQEVSIQVAKAYFLCVVTKQRVGIIDANLDRVNKTLEDTRKFVKAGFAESIDVDRLEVAQLNLQTERSKLQASEKITLLLLKFQMGMPVQDSLVLTQDIDLSKMPAPTQFTANANDRPEWKVLESSLSLNELDKQRYIQGYYPNLIIYGSAQTTAQRQEFDFFDTKARWFPITLVGATINVPIFDGFQKEYKKQQAQLAIDKVKNQMDGFKKAIDFQIEQANISYANQYKSMEAQRRSVELAERVVKNTQIKFEKGVGSNLELVSAEAALKEAQTNYYGSLYDLTVAYLDIINAQGKAPY